VRTLALGPNAGRGEGSGARPDFAHLAKPLWLFFKLAPERPSLRTRSIGSGSGHSLARSAARGESNSRAPRGRIARKRGGPIGRPCTRMPPGPAPLRWDAPVRAQLARTHAE